MGETRVTLGEAEDGLAVSAHTAGLRWRYGRLEASTPRLALSGACAFSLGAHSQGKGLKVNTGLRGLVLRFGCPLAAERPLYSELVNTRH